MMCASLLCRVILVNGYGRPRWFRAPARVLGLVEIERFNSN